MSRSAEVIEVSAIQPVVPDLVERAAAVRRLADEHLDEAYRLARAILRDAAEAEDATHDAFVQAWLKWPSLRDLSRFEAWFDRILVNTCRDRLRRTRRIRLRDLSLDLAAPPSGPSRPVQPIAGPGRPRRSDREALGGPPHRRGPPLLP